MVGTTHFVRNSPFLHIKATCGSTIAVPAHTHKEACAGPGEDGGGLGEDGISCVCGRLCCADGAWRRLIASLRGGSSLVTSADAIPSLKELLREANTSIAPQEAPAELDIPLERFTSAVIVELKNSSPHSAGGRDGGRATHWQVGSGNERFEKLLAAALMRWLTGKAPPGVDDILAFQNLFAAKKPNGGVRPIAVGSFLRRLASSSWVRK